MSIPTTQPPILPGAAAARLFKGDLELLREGLKHGLRMDAIWPTWEIPLLHGVALLCPPRAPAMVEALLGAGAAVSQSHRNLTPMMYAIAGFNRETGDPLAVRLETIKALHQADPHPNMAMWAMTCVRVGYKAALEYLLEAGCDPDSSLENGHTLLHEAYARKDAEIGNLLVNHGANPDALNVAGEAPGQQMARQANEDSVTQLQQSPTQQAEIQALDLAIKTRGNPDDMPEGRHFRL